MAQQIQLRCDPAAVWASVNPVLAQAEMGVELVTNKFKIGDGVTPWNSLGYGLNPQQSEKLPYIFGDGSDGDANLVSGTLVFSRDMYYENLTISDTAQIQTNGFRLFVKGTLDLSSAPARAIVALANNGTSATTQTGGATGAAISANTIGGSAAGAAGATGVAGVGAQALNSSVVSPGNGGVSGAGGAGGSGGSGAGGSSRSGTSVTQTTQFRRVAIDLLRGPVLVLGGNGAPGGSCGAGDGTNLGRGGGGGGAGGGVLAIFAKTIIRSNTTPDGIIAARGGNGGNGASATVGNVGGGGGGAGGGGGWIYLVFETLAGTSALNALTAMGGNGGNGGNGFGTGTGGNGGSSGAGGRITVYDLGVNESNDTTGPVSVTGGTASGVNGGNGASATGFFVGL